MASKNSIKNKTVLLLPYFGNWPPYLNLYLQSCSYNSWMDILFLTDSPFPAQYPSNVRFLKSSLAEISALIVEKLGLDGYELPSAYKLCDFKPTYGKVFEDYINSYEYWAYGDIDLIYGNLEAKIKPELEAGIDVISARAEIVSGSFTLIKNNTYNNQLFRKLSDFDQLIISDRYEGLDETSHNATIWSGLSKSDLPTSSFTYLVAKEAEDGHIKASFKTFICEHLAKHQRIKYQNKELYYENQTLGYFHYVMNKGKVYFTFPGWTTLPKVFYITETGFYKYLWMAVLISPVKKFIYLFFYKFKRIPGFILKKMKLSSHNH